MLNQRMSVSHWNDYSLKFCDKQLKLVTFHKAKYRKKKDNYIHLTSSKYVYIYVCKDVQMFSHMPTTNICYFGELQFFAHCGYVYLLINQRRTHLA